MSKLVEDMAEQLVDNYHLDEHWGSCSISEQEREAWREDARQLIEELGLVQLDGILSRIDSKYLAIELSAHMRSKEATDLMLGVLIDLKKSLVETKVR